MSPNQESEEPETEIRDSPTEEKKDKERATVTSSKAAAKRRTKTGCLTCRRRRIKCGEEKPFCKNCIKSKRDCAGYVQPLVYKQHNQGPHSAGHDGTDRGPFSEHDQFQFNAVLDSNTGQPGFFNPFSYTGYQDIGHNRHESLPSSQAYQYPPPDASTSYSYQPSMPLVDASRRHSMHHMPSQYPYGLSELHVNVQRDDQPWSARSQQSSISDSTPFPFGDPSSNLTSPYGVYPHPHSGATSYVPYEATALHDAHPRRYSVHGFVQTAPYGSAGPTLANPMIDVIPKEEESEESEDYSDTEMEDTSELDDSVPGKQQEFAELMNRNRKRLSQGAKQHSHVRKSQALQTAHHRLAASPLQDERNQRIFCHFVEVAGRCMTIWERQPTEMWSLPPRTLWSYTLPTAAMSQPALAHAMLALGGLHIAKLQNTSTDPSLKHFTYALRRVSKLLSLPKRRHEIVTLATVLLLGFYEVLAADHSRWNLHLSGATKLVIEHDYAAMIRSVRRMRNRAKRNISDFSKRAALTEENYLAVASVPVTLLDDEEWEVDQNIISALTGQEVDYDHQVQPNFSERKPSLDLSEKDVTDFKIKMDLRWWYCKQDVFQSMISGDPLLMEYRQWIYCPPRGRIGNASIPYGTFDHLLLVLGRLTDFGGHDRSRKQRVVASQGGQWKPPPGFFPPGAPGPPAASGVSRKVHAPSTSTVSATEEANITPTSTADQEHLRTKQSTAPSANEGRLRQSKPGPSQQVGPAFYGTMPPPPLPPKMHSSFYAMNDQLQGTSGQTPVTSEGSTKGVDLKVETEKALAEHTAIGNAFDLFARSLGPDFEPIANDGSFPHTSPFGPPLRYRTIAIALIWLHWHVGKIMWHRLHPHMPPAAMVSAGITAHLTKEHAQTAGKVAAGLYAMTSGGPSDLLNPVFAGAMIESTFPLLFAAIQYQDMSQRGWTISKLHDIAHMTGWQTSGAVAAACEIAWERMGQAGKGPPYTRSLDRNNIDARVNGTSRRVDAGFGRDSSPPTDAISIEPASHFLSHDRSLIGKHGPTRVHWALGLLSVEEDIKNLSINK